jgi:hypothetical protein
LNIGTYADHTIDAFGDAYEYLMQMYERRSRTAVFNLSSFGPRRHVQL